MVVVGKDRGVKDLVEGKAVRRGGDAGVGASTIDKDICQGAS